MFSHLRISQKVVIQVILIFISVIWIVPLFTAVVESLKIGGFNNYLLVLNHPKISLPRVTYNSFFIATVSCLAVTFMVALAGYAFSKMQFKGKSIFYYSLLVCLAIPPAAILTPLLITTKVLGLMDTHIAVILPVVALQLPFMLMIVKNYFDTIPSPILEAARIDGCTSFKVFYMIIVPLAKPALINALVLTFISAWNEYLIPLLFIRKPAKYTVTLATTYFSGGMHQTPDLLAQQYAALILISLPSIVVYIFCQKYMQAGLTAGAVKS